MTGRGIMVNRIGWVSNSSSTSFIVIGKRLRGIGDIDFESGKNYIGITWDDLGEAPDRIILTPETLAKLEEIGYLDFSVWQVVKEIWGDENNVYFPKGEWDIESMEVSYFTSDTPEDVEEHWGWFRGQKGN